MDRSTTTIDGITSGGTAANPVSAKVEGAAKAAHQATDKIAERANAGIDRLSGASHRAIDSTADAATSAAEWTSTIPEQARQVQMRLTESACASIRARPIATVAGALVVGYLLGRLARL